MTLEQVSLVSQMVAALGVIASLIFVGYQVRDSARAVRSATAQAVHDNYANWYLTLADNPLALATSLKGAVDYDSLTAAEKAQFVCTFKAFLSLGQNAFHQYREGHLAEQLWAGWEILMLYVVKTPGGATFWRERRHVFGKDFQSEVDRIMQRAPPLGAKAFGVVPVA